MQKKSDRSIEKFGFKGRQMKKGHVDSGEVKSPFESGKSYEKTTVR